MCFIERILNLVEQQGISKNKLLTDLKLSKNSFVNWEERKTIPGGDTLLKIAEYFNCSVDYLLGRDWGSNISGLSNTEKEIIDKFRSLSDEGRDYILKTLDIASYKYNKMPDEMVAYDVEDTVIEEYKPKKPETTAD